MQTIETKYISPSNVRGAKIKATAESGSLTLSWDHSLNSEENHDMAARTLIKKLGWCKDSEPGAQYGEWFRGGLKGGGYVYVCAVNYAKLKLEKSANV